MNILEKALHDNGYPHDAALLEKISSYLTLLQKWNKVFNLTAIREHEEMVWLHILDSLSITPYLRGNRILDVGTGAGLPGIPLALTLPEKEFFLLDSNIKKIRFLTHVKAELNIENVQLIYARAEDFYFPGGFDSIISRAVSSLLKMLQVTQHLLAPSGQFLAMKGIYPEQELIEMPDQYQATVYKLSIIGLSVERCVVRIVKR